MLFLCLCFALLIPGIFSDSTQSCDTFRVCPNFQQTTQAVDEDSTPFQDESEIGKLQHWEGIRPVHYDLALNFENITHYTGSVSIEFTVVRPTNKILINHHKVNPQIDYSKIAISNCNLEYGTRPSRPPKQGCIQKATFTHLDSFPANNDHKLALELSITLAVNESYVIRFESFNGRSKSIYPDRESEPAKLHGAEGLDDDANLYQPTITAVTTIFQMRHARSVFPCFDHPSLKATFHLCMEYPTDIMVASNTMVENSTAISTDRKRDCFQKTPRMSTYIFTIAVMKNYTSQTIQVPNNGPIVELLAPKHRIANLTWMLQESVPVIQYLENITGFKYPMKRLAFVAQYPAPFWGVENFGLITVDGHHMETKRDLSYVILYHEIVHMWLGNVITISHWSEICLQEGLTAYFEWKISARYRNGSFLQKVQEERAKLEMEGYYEPYGSRIYHVTQDIANNCYGRPSLFFHMASVLCGGFHTVENLLKKLIEKVPFGTASIDVYDQALGEVCKVNQSGSEMSLGPGFIKSWFLEPGYLFLTAWQNPAKPTCIGMGQILHRSAGNLTSVRPAPIPLLILNQDGTTSRHSDYMKTAPYEICGQTKAGSSFIIDPEGEVFTQKAYTATNYIGVMQFYKQHPQNVNQDHIKTFVRNFCFALLGDRLPLREEPASTTTNDWLQVFELMKSSNMTGTPNRCWCCLQSKEAIESRNWTMPRGAYCYKSVWDIDCANLALMTKIGRNYTFNRPGE